MLSKWLSEQLWNTKKKKKKIHKAMKAQSSLLNFFSLSISLLDLTSISPPNTQIFGSWTYAEF